MGRGGCAGGCGGRGDYAGGGIGVVVRVGVGVVVGVVVRVGVGVVVGVGV